jgi:hypothetical protein
MTTIGLIVRRTALASAMLLSGCGDPGAPMLPDTVHLFDCTGWIQAIGPDGLATPAVRISGLDASLPNRVRDGCAIHAGWYDLERAALVLEVQTAALADADDELPTRFVSLSLPNLDPLESSASPTAWAAARNDPAAALLPTDDAPFSHARAYVREEAGSMLLEEVVNVAGLGPTGEVTPASRARGVTEERPPATRDHYVLPHVWRAGIVTLRTPADARATGRYALMDLESGAQRGSLLTLPPRTAGHRVLCFSSDGLVLLALDPHTLLVLDAREPNWSSTVSGPAVDLNWTGCAAG